MSENHAFGIVHYFLNEHTFPADVLVHYWGA